MDLIVKNVKLRGKKELVDIGIKGKKIIKIGKIPHSAFPARNASRSDAGGRIPHSRVIDAKGKLVTESFVNAHLHLCKVYTLRMMTEKALTDYQSGGNMGKAMKAIEEASKVKEKYSEKMVIANATKAVKLAALNGNTHIRAFVDVDSKAKLIGIKALIKVREKFKGIVDIQVVAFPQDGVIREPGAEKLIDEAMKLGADIVGGIPWIEFTEEASKSHIDKMFKIAKKYNKDVAMLIDDAGDPTLRTLEMFAVATIKNGWHGRTCTCHARAMQLYPQPYFEKIAALMREAKMGVVSDPHTGPLHARVRELLAEGNLVCLGQDDITDAYYPFGRNNMLEVGFLACHLLWMITFKEMNDVYDMITTNAAKAIGLKNFQIKVGAEANMVVLDEDDIWEALRNHSEPLYTISHGKLVDMEKIGKY